MALPKKRSRKITVNDVVYRYIVTGNDDYIDLILEQDGAQGQRMTVSFRYHSTTEKGTGRLIQRNQITPVVVKRTIHYGLENGWLPGEKQTELRINWLDDEIELNLRSTDEM